MADMGYRVAVTVSPEYPVNMRVVRDVFGCGSDVAEVAVPFRRLDEAETRCYAEQLRGFDAILVRSGIFDEALLKRLETVKIIALHGAGYDQVDADAAARMGIAMSNTPGANAVAVAELTMGLMLTLSRKLFDSIRGLKTCRDWNGARLTAGELYGKRLGLVGLGQIGREVALRSLAFGMKVGAFCRNVPLDFCKANGIEALSAEALFTESDIISLHVPLTEKTRYMIDEKSIGLMKNTCMLINTSRGALVNEDDLCDALRSGRIAGAALDVFEPEPLREDSPLFGLENAIITPHIGGSTREALANVACMASEDILSFLKTGHTPHLVNAPRQA